MTSEEYKKELARYWDSIRETKLRIEDAVGCVGVKCDNCILFSGVCESFTASVSLDCAKEAVELVEQWSKEHPIKTNGQVAKELLEERFGIKLLDFYSCDKIDCDQVKKPCEDCDECEFKRFWKQEYKER